MNELAIRFDVYVDPHLRSGRIDGNRNGIGL
jgi:hypothetical protein